MRTPRIICLSLILSVLFLPVLIQPTISQIPPYETGDWDFSGKRHEQKHRQIVIPLEGQDSYRIRTFIYCLDSDFDDEETIDNIIAIFGVQEIRNAPFFSDFFEETSVIGIRATYSFSIEENSGIEWLLLDDTVKNETAPDYDPLLAYIYERVESKIRTSVNELYDLDNFNMTLPVNLAYLNQTTGTVGYWQILYDDGTLINGNFTTLGPDNPLFVDPKEPENTEFWWPDYKVTIAQNIGRSSLPRSHNIKVGVSFMSILSGLIAIIVIIKVAQVTRRNKK